MEERYYSLQILRAVAAWMVFYHHYMQLFYGFKYESIFGKFFSNYGSFGVDIFFVISGFIMYFSVTNPSANAFSFFVRRFFRVVPTYWFYSAMMIVAIKLFPIEFAYTDYDIKSLLFSLSFIPVANPSGIGIYPLHTVGWTLNFEMMFYIILSLSILVSRKNSLIICSILLLLFPIVWPENLPFSQVLSSAKLYEFFAGIVLAAIVTSNWFKFFDKHRIVLSLSAMFFGLLCLKHKDLHLFFELTAASFIVFSTVSFNPYLSENNAITKFLIRLGDCSYSTYLIHIFLIGISVHFFGNALGAFAELVLLIGLSITLYLLSKYSYIFLERSTHILKIMQYILTLANNKKLFGQNT